MSKFELLCQLKAISEFAYDIHYTADGRNFYSDHIFSERLADVDVEDDFIETLYLGESEDAPSSVEINEKVASITPEAVADTQTNFKALREMIVKALMMIEKYKFNTKAEEDLLGSVAHILQRHNGLLFRQLRYTPEEIRNSDDDIDYWFSTKTGAHIPVKKGQSRGEAMKNFFDGKEKSDGWEKSRESKDGISRRKKDYTAWVEKTSNGYEWGLSREGFVLERGTVSSMEEAKKRAEDIQDGTIKAGDTFYRSKRDEYEKKWGEEKSDGPFSEKTLKDKISTLETKVKKALDDKDKERYNVYQKDLEQARKSLGDIQKAKEHFGDSDKKSPKSWTDVYKEFDNPDVTLKELESLKSRGDAEKFLKDRGYDLNDKNVKEAISRFIETSDDKEKSGKDDNPNSWTRKEAKEYWDKNKEDDPDGMLYRFKSFEDFYKAGVESGDIKEEKSDTDKKEPEKKKDESKKEEIPQQRTPNKTPAGEDVKWKFDDGKYSTQLSSGAKLTIEWKKPVDEYMSPWRYKIEYKGDTWYGGEESKDVAQIVAIDTAERAAGKIKAHYTDWRSLERERRRIDHYMS